METIFFGPYSGVRASERELSFSRSAVAKSACHLQKVRSAQETAARLTAARRIHHEVCSMLLSAYESLQDTLVDFFNLLRDNERPKLDFKECSRRLESLSDMAKVKIELFMQKNESQALCGVPHGRTLNVSMRRNVAHKLYNPISHPTTTIFSTSIFCVPTKGMSGECQGYERSQESRSKATR
jgi:hypothetical protein